MSQPPLDPDEIDRRLGQAGRQALVRLAWASVLAAVQSRPTPDTLVNSAPQIELFGAFVSLHRKGALRGCIGHVGQVASAATLVADAGRSAAIADPRFPAVEARELADLELEISLLTPLIRLDPGDLPDAVTVGRDGLVVEDGYHRGLLLPQVATEYGWNKERFLEETCRKAGLPRHAWKAAAHVSRFSALIIPGGIGPVSD